MEYEIDWEPQDRQLKFLEACGLDGPFTDKPLRQAVADVVGYGGAAGGGKTDSLLGIGITAAFAYPGINVAYFRREFPQLEGLGGAIPRSLELLTGIASYNEQKHRWLFPTRGKIQFYHCKDPKDVFNHKSQQFDILIIDEVTEWLAEMVDFLIMRNRATITYPTFRPFAAFGTNPGDVGHLMFKERFVDVGIPEVVHDFSYPTGVKRKHIFIPSRLSDNIILETRDPSYRERLSTSEYNKKVYLDGDWNVFAGQVFNFQPIKDGKPYHVIATDHIPEPTIRYISLDWGGNAPVSIGWHAVINVTSEPGVMFQRIWRYRELYYGIQGEISSAEDFKQRTGLDFTDKNVAKVIAEKSEGEVIDYVVGDPAMDNKRRRDQGLPGKSIMESMNEYWDDNDINLFIKPGDNDRKNGLDRVRFWLSKAPDGLPYYQVNESCKSFIRTVPMLMYKPGEEDVDTDLEDHAYDEMRYGVMSRPYGAMVPKAPTPAETPNTFDWHLKKMRERRLQQEAML